LFLFFLMDYFYFLELLVDFIGEDIVDNDILFNAYLCCIKNKKYKEYLSLFIVACKEINICSIALALFHYIKEKNYFHFDNYKPCLNSLTILYNHFEIFFENKIKVINNNNYQKIGKLFTPKYYVFEITLIEILSKKNKKIKNKKLKSEKNKKKNILNLEKTSNKNIIINHKRLEKEKKLNQHYENKNDKNQSRFNIDGGYAESEKLKLSFDNKNKK